MSDSLVCVDSNDSIIDAANIVIKKQISNLPVMENTKIV